MRSCEYVWISHGHPDHLNVDSEPYYCGKKILLPDHVGGRIRRGFQEAGLDVTVLKDGVWHKLSDRIRVLCLANYMQDGILLIDVNGRLLVNMNDANWLCGWLLFIRRIVKQFDKSFLLHLTNHGDADMINLRDEEGRLMLRNQLVERPPLDDQIQIRMNAFGTRGFIPFIRFTGIKGRTASGPRNTRSDWTNTARIRQKVVTPTYRAGFFPPSFDIAALPTSSRNYAPVRRRRSCMNRSTSTTAGVTNSRRTTRRKPPAISRR